MGETRWAGSMPQPQSKARCPFAVHFEAKAIPAEKLDSLEAGRLQLCVSLSNNDVSKNDNNSIKSVAVKITNNTKLENLDKVECNREIKCDTSISAVLKSGKNGWIGELSVPATWVEGRTESYERTGSFTPKSESDNLFTMAITYVLQNGGNDSCTAEFNSMDVFHWEVKPKAQV